MAILIAAWMNTTLKCVLVVVLGSRALGRRLVAPSLSIFGAGVLAALLW